MDVNQKFDGVTCDTTICVSELDMNRKYRILWAKRLTTRFGSTVILTIKGEDSAEAQIFLPRRYSDVFTDSDTEQINSNTVFLHLIFKGVCTSTKAYLLLIEMYSVCFHYRLTFRHETPRHGILMDKPVFSKTNASYAPLSDKQFGWYSSRLYVTTIYISTRHYFSRFVH